jgi:hypothetical protein
VILQTKIYKSFKIVKIMNSLKKLLIALLAVSCAAVFASCDDEDAPTLKDILEREPVQLGTPSGLAINGTVLSWNAVQNARTYAVRIEGVGLFSGLPSNSHGLGVGLTSGETYRVAVMAKEHITDTVNYSDSEWSEEIEYLHYVVDGDSIVIGQLATPTNLRINGTVLTWDTVARAIGYGEVGYSAYFESKRLPFPPSFSSGGRPLLDFADDVMFYTGEVIITVSASAYAIEGRGWANSGPSNAVTFEKLTPPISGLMWISGVYHSDNSYGLSDFEQLTGLSMSYSVELIDVAESALYDAVIELYQGVFAAQGVTILDNFLDFYRETPSGKGWFPVHVTLPDNSFATLQFSVLRTNK